MANSWTRSLRDASGILRRARNPAELAKALLPNQWLARKVLNDDMADAGGTTPTDVAEALRKLRNELKQEALDDNGQIDYANRVIRVPITFRYYQSDFGRAAGVRLFLVDHARNAQREALEAAFQAGYELDYHRYDWSLNSRA